MNKRTVWNKLFTIVLSISMIVGTFAAFFNTSNVASAEEMPLYKDANASTPDRVADLLSRMTLDEKIGQMTQVERNSIGADSNLATFNIGSVLSGGGSAPSPNTPEAWANMYDGYQRAALQSNLQIPIIYGIDAVHGNNNAYGATIFPHNIGLGAARNPELLREIGRATAEEVAGTGVDWTFAPCLCVSRDERWGRTYESYGEDPEIASSYVTIIEGLQGDLRDSGTILANAKHWVGDGGTLGGDDQGDTVLSEQELREIHIPPFIDAIEAGVGSVMASFSSWNGEKLHGHKYLLTDVLKDELGFEGFVVSDWAGIDQLPGDYASDVRNSINAGIDMVMVPQDYRTFINTLRIEVNEGRVPMSRIDDAVSRILTQKFELGLFEQPFTDRTYTSTIGSQEHRDIARDAVRQSLVLLKNEGDILPLDQGLDKVFVAGKNANDIGNQSGGWTITWQGQSGDITPGTTILEGIQSTVSPSTEVTFNESGDGINSSYDVAVVVVGETPYAEGEGDRPNDLRLDQTDLATLQTIQSTGVPTVVILVSGRPMVVTDELANWDAFVAAWLPGTEGDGVAEVLFGVDGYEFTGKLPFTWPRSESQIPMNVGDASYDPLFEYGFGLEYGDVVIPPVVDPIDAFERIEAESFNSMSGVQTEETTDVDGGENVGWLDNEDYLVFNKVDFDDGATGVEARVASQSAGGTIEFRLDSTNGELIGTVDLTNTGGWQDWVTNTAAVSNATGIHDLYVVFKGETQEGIGNLNWFVFTKEMGTTPPTGEDKIETDEYTIEMVNDDPTSVTFIFTPTLETSSFVDLHYKVNDGVQQNVKATENGDVWEYTVTGLQEGDSLSFYYTYEKEGLAYDTPEYDYTN
ncbi:glycoside hydrolase family 3 protein [Bacillus solimangrovi]|uniref:beta-glucosidase n=1 Tax=Bacillus solimangrovi TaxID=1305675 RepID=A0A1E5LIC4_9BACI|nr:glycoside hydrolase family 3 protein [Bacillus solimangrovi]OEH93821.1 hypothetical protein BFG57_10885 [Bacillus solimangrovi]